MQECLRLIYKNGVVFTRTNSCHDPGKGLHSIAGLFDMNGLRMKSASIFVERLLISKWFIFRKTNTQLT